MQDGKMLKPTDVAAILGVSHATVIRLIHAHLLEAVNIGTGKIGHWRISERALEKFVAERSTL